MPKDEQASPADPEQPPENNTKRWFRPNQSGPGWHPGSWQGWLILLSIVAAIVVVVVLLRTGVL
ncbi:MAG TPA: hypothetical protein VN045_02560 [Microbacteriaceae bacterium]|jgi:hypothetical protein|nr:hypothetical protein [Microbacteriaceae bacterium]